MATDRAHNEGVLAGERWTHNACSSLRDVLAEDECAQVDSVSV
jgi:hypothetical protein